MAQQKKMPEELWVTKPKPFSMAAFIFTVMLKKP
jgi:hypothetical protein